MPKVFTITPGAEIRVGNFGLAAYENGIEVPEAVADQLEDEIAGMPREVEGKRVRTHEKRTDLRVERAVPERRPSAALPKNAVKDKE
jgi:hypothetical protein